jgi:hypothetical protein
LEECLLFEYIVSFRGGCFYHISHKNLAQHFVCVWKILENELELEFFP